MSDCDIFHCSIFNFLLYLISIYPCLSILRFTLNKTERYINLTWETKHIYGKFENQKLEKKLIFENYMFEITLYVNHVVET